MTSEAPPSRPRIAALDFARGAAIVAMIIYHFGWNLSFLGLISADLRDQPVWLWFGHLIAASFLALVGVGLVLAHGDGFRARLFLRRLALIAGGAALVSAGTYIVFPQQFIFFGILHAIAISSVLASLFLRAPVAVIVLAALIVAILPTFAQSDTLSSPWLIWLGLGTRVPSTQDFVPIFPWFSAVLVGMAIARIIDLPSLPGLTARALFPLQWLGRNSLGIYLAHQPILFGALSLIVMALAPAQDREARGFLSACQTECRNTGGNAAICTATCRCTVEGLKSANLWSSVIADRIEPSLQSRFEAITRRCAEMSSLPR